MATSACQTGLADCAIANIALIATLSTFLLILVSLRLYIRLAVVRAFWYDDAAILVSLLLLLPSYAITVQLHTQGLGKHVGCLDNKSSNEIRAEAGSIVALDLLSLMFTRVSVALLIYRLFPLSGPLKWSVVVLLIAMSGFTIAQSVLDAGAVSTSFNFAVTLTTAVIAILSDLVLATIPIFMLKSVQMSRQTKAGVATVLALGYVTAMFSIARTIFAKESFTQDVSYSPVKEAIAAEFVPNHSFGSTLAANLAIPRLEAAVAITAGSVPTIRSLFIRRRPTSRNSSNRQVLNTGGYLRQLTRRRSDTAYGDSHPATVPIRPMTIQVASDRAPQSALSGHHTTADIITMAAERL